MPDFSETESSIASGINSVKVLSIINLVPLTDLRGVGSECVSELRGGHRILI